MFSRDPKGYGMGNKVEFGAFAKGSRLALANQHAQEILLCYLAASDERDTIVVLFDPRDPLGRCFREDGDSGMVVRAYDREDVVQRVHGRGMHEAVWDGLCTDSRRGCLALLILAAGGATYTHPTVSGQGLAYDPFPIPGKPS